MGIGVLVSRNHYWIDVLGAYFMTYSIYVLGTKMWDAADLKLEKRKRA